MASKKNSTTFTPLQVTEMTHEAYWEGMADCHEITMTAMEQLRNSIEDVHSIYYMGIVLGDKKQKADELMVAIDTLTHLVDVFQGRYEDAMDKSKAERRRRAAIEDAAQLGFYE
jgi:hypothetical protein